MVKSVDLSGGQNEKYALPALLSRMKYIKRWVRMRNTREESLSEHVVDTSLVAHMLCLIARKQGIEVREGEVSLVVLYHDISEIATGDMPSPVKYKNKAFLELYKKIESESALNFLDYLPDDYVDEMRKYITGDHLTDDEKTLVKSADLISGMIKCIEEGQGGNKEFETALKRLYNKIQEMNFKPAIEFVELFIPNYYSDLDAIL